MNPYSLQLRRLPDGQTGAWIIPPYLIDQPERSAGAREIVEALRDCDGVVLASPGYHGSFSGLLKNVIDYAEDLAHEQRPYLAGRVVGCIATGLGWQAIGTTLASLRSVVHALGAWPTPMGVAMNTAGKVFDENNRVLVPEVATELDTLAAQLIEFARMRKLYLESISDRS